MGARNEALSLSLFLSLNSSTRKLPILQMGNKTIISCSTHTRTFLVPMILQRSHTSFLELLQAGRHRVVRLLTTLLASAPLALVLADARAPALLALAPDALVRADARSPALLALAPLALVLAEARPPALLASAPSALVLVETVCTGRLTSPP